MASRCALSKSRASSSTTFLLPLRASDGLATVPRAHDFLLMMESAALFRVLPPTLGNEEPDHWEGPRLEYRC